LNVESTVFISAPQAVPVVIRIVTKPTKELGVADVVLNGLGLTGIILIAALLFGALLGGLFIWLKHRMPDNRLNGQASQHDGLQITAVALDSHRQP
jgi:hypothetical protein